jgi:hypothetical protein
MDSGGAGLHQACLNLSRTLTTHHPNWSMPPRHAAEAGSGCLLLGQATHTCKTARYRHKGTYGAGRGGRGVCVCGGGGHRQRGKRLLKKGSHVCGRAHPCPHFIARPQQAYLGASLQRAWVAEEFCSQASVERSSTRGRGWVGVAHGKGPGNERVRRALRLRLFPGPWVGTLGPTHVYDAGGKAEGWAGRASEGPGARRGREGHRSWCGGHNHGRCWGGGVRGIHRRGAVLHWQRRPRVQGGGDPGSCRSRICVMVGRAGACHCQWLGRWELHPRVCDQRGLRCGKVHRLWNRLWDRHRQCCCRQGARG